MQLYLIRHGIAVEWGAAGFEDDRLRPLTEKGREKMVKIARGLLALDVRFDLIISSPYTRALETARILFAAQKMDKGQLVIQENLSPGSPPDEILGEIKEKYSSLESIAIVSHEPALGALISRLVAGQRPFFIHIKKGSVCHLSVDDLTGEPRARLEWLLHPAHLAALGEKLPD